MTGTPPLMAEQALAVASQALRRIEVHEAGCSERWKAATKKMDDNNAAIHAATKWVIGTLVSAVGTLLATLFFLASQVLRVGGSGVG